MKRATMILETKVHYEITRRGKTRTYYYNQMTGTSHNRLGRIINEDCEIGQRVGDITRWYGRMEGGAR